MSAIGAIGRRAFGVLSSMGLACVLFAFLGILTWLGTLEQVHAGLYDVQRKYFESYVLVHDAGGVPIPLPGANLVLSILCVNLVLGGIVRIRKSRDTLGILVAHVGIVLLLAAGLVKHRASDDGRVTLFEGESASWFESDYRWEIALREELGHGSAMEHVVPLESVAHARPGAEVVVVAGEPPIELDVRAAFDNARPSTMRDDSGPGLVPVARERETIRNVPGVVLALSSAGGERAVEVALWGAQGTPAVVSLGGRRHEIELRRERHALPFTLALADFRKEDHPRTGMPKSFESDVLVDDDRRLTISMNEPLRQDGFVVYQASWGPQGAAPGARLFSTFAVVRNPADQWPLVACIVIALGLVLHFGRRLARHVRLQAAHR